MSFERARIMPLRRVGAVRFSSNIVAPIAVLTDLLCLILSAPPALLMHSLLIGERLDPSVHYAVAAIGGVTFFLIRLSRDAYAQPFGRAQDADQGVIFDYFVATLLSVAAIWQLGLASELSRGLMLLYIGTAGSLLFLSRFAMRQIVWRLAQSGHIAQRVVLYGATSEMTERAFRLLELERLPHLQIVGFVDDRVHQRSGSAPNHLPFMGGLSDLLEVVRRGEVDQVILALPDITQTRLDEILSQLDSVAVDVSLLPREALVLTSGYKVGFIGSAPILSLWRRPVRDMDSLLKSLEDKLLAAAGLLFLAPLLICVASAIKATSPGPILFTQRRHGFNNAEISIFKFRSMYVERQDVSGAKRTERGDARVTPIGRLIRRLSIDELPQLWNVLRGEMSIVGPRPHATHMKVGDRYYFDAVKGYASRHRVKPGLTGLAQVRGLRGEIATIERAKLRVDYDLFYIDNWSLMLDLRIILETVVKLVGDRNAY